ncbi:MAG TPA: copper oxidase [Thermoanaerobaculia bacterium]|nr:copper oxidase [Thermoanaerobaculia bacterium]
MAAPLRRLFLVFFAALALSQSAQAQSCARTITAEVVAFDQVFFWNRLGAVQPQGMMFALQRDVVAIEGSTPGPGNAQLRPDKRPRPIVLRMNVGDCLRITFKNWLDDQRRDQNQSNTRKASIHIVGMQWAVWELDDGTYAGRNDNSVINVGGTATYTLYGEREGEHVLYSAGALAGGEGDGGHVNAGLFGAVIVEPQGARWYRSQVTRQELDWATTGTTAYGQPIINYEATYPSPHPRAGQPILNMLSGTGIVHTDLTAIIAGSSPGGTTTPKTAGWFPAGTFPLNKYTYPQREQPFREFTILYHDEIGAVQAFKEFEQNYWEHTLHSGRDGFAINYGAAGIGAEVLANRFGLGPMGNCVECKFEEFFLSSWVVGDPAMILDTPAVLPCQNASPPCLADPNPVIAKAIFPSDPSNVYHGYLHDHTRFRVLHAGTKEHHIHHLHAHQWLFTADSDKSTYLDSQAIGPGASFTAEIAYEGAGNLNLTPGDAIFHCHFYPHFAQGMWSLWRVHDVFERGTILDADGRPQTGANRALPDGVIARGTPIPAVVPLPGKPMAPMPGATVQIVGGQAVVSGTGNPGFPFYVPAKAGHRPPKPPLDTIDDGGLPRHRINSGEALVETTRFSFRKELQKIVAEQLADDGTTIEKQAMTFHETAAHNSCEPNGVCSLQTLFVTNGLPRVQGAPYADPCRNAEGQAAGVPRTIKAADIQNDVKLNKAGWHFGQQRFSALWEDVDDYLAWNNAPQRAPEPLFFRANSKTCITFWLTNLVPKEYQQDDFQVRTPTDVLGQHIHLVKFDVTASDGAANGFNYEDGSFSPGDVRERIKAIRKQNGCSEPTDPRDGTFTCPKARTHPFFGAGPDVDGEPGPDWIGAQTTAQRWYADPLLDNNAFDRTLRTVFTHDHFSPSTHQQAGLYAGLVVEPENSTWAHNETGDPLGPVGSRHDGGPTTWQAIIDPPQEPSYREFLLEFADFQLAYTGNEAINPPGRKEVGLPDLLMPPVDECPGSTPEQPLAPPCPELISADDPGTMSVNYRNEPIALRVRSTLSNSQASGQKGDLSFAFASIQRQDTRLNSRPAFYPPLTNDVKPYDPFTPLLRAYENDRVQIRILVGAHEEGHNFSVHGIKWLFEPSEPDSGYKNSQMMGISEHFEFIVPQLVKNPMGSSVDRLWSAGSATDDYWNGIWGLLRAYTGLRNDLKALPENPNGRSNIDPSAVGAWDFSCPKDTPVRAFDVTAVAARNALPGGRLYYNQRTDGAFGPLFDQTGILYFRSEDLERDASNVLRLKAGRPIEPLILRARAGECIQLTLRNEVPSTPYDWEGYNTLPMLVPGFNANDIKPSVNVGLHPQLLYYDVSRSDGANVGNNSTQTVAPGGPPQTYHWYAGDVKINDDGSVTATPVEFGATNLISSDRIEHASKGAIGALIIEPAGAVISEPSTTTHAVANITNPSPLPNQQASFREFVVLFQNDVNLRTDQELPHLCDDNPIVFPGGAGWPVENLGCMEDPEDTGQKAVNFRTEPLWKRMQHAPGTQFADTDNFDDWWDVLSNSTVGAEPQTPIFSAAPGELIRFRVLQPGGHARNIVFALHGHAWDKEPYIQDSTRIGRNGFSFWEGARTGHGPTNHFDAVIRFGAGGKFSIRGDYLFRDQTGTGLDNGLWGLLRVE